MEKYRIKKTVRLFLGLVLPLGICLKAHAKDPAKRWKDSAEVSVVSTNGNSKATTISAKNDFSYEWMKSSVKIQAGGLGTESQDRTVAEQFFANEKLKLNLREKDYLFERFGWEKNRFAGILNRYDSSGGFGYNFLNKENKNQFLLEIGAGYINEERDGSSRNEFGSGRSYAKYSRALTDSSNFGQEAEYLHNFKDKDDYRLTTTSALTAVISTHLSLKVSYVWNRTFKPPKGFAQDDTVTGVSLLFNY